MKEQIVHEKKLMEQVSKNCLRNVFYDIYFQENK